MRLIFSLRNPVERAWSQARMLARADNLDLSDEIALIAFLHSDRCVSRGSYSQTIELWRKSFGADALLIELFDDVIAEPAAVLNRIGAHIGISGAAAFEPVAAVGQPINFGEPLAIPWAIRMMLLDFYRPEIERTAQLIDRPLNSWLEVA